MKFETRAARLNGPYDIELIQRDLVCGDDDIIVKNHLMGICGSDKNFYRGFMPPKTAEFRQDPKFPFRLGHESGGTVVAVGSKVMFAGGIYGKVVRMNGDDEVIGVEVAPKVIIDISRFSIQAIEK